ncbi:MAG: phosphate signaling complex protein PhoU [Fibrobacterota bacterium]
MPIHLHKDIRQVEEMLMTCTAHVENSLVKAVNAFINRDRHEAEKVISDDDVIDNLEIEIEEECLKILALHQPVAGDLRFIISVLKINSDLERIGDYAASISKRTNIILDIKNGFEYQLPFGDITDKTIEMIKNSIDSLVNQDSTMAYKVIESIDEINTLKEQIFQLFLKEVKEKPEKAEVLSNQMFIARYLDRIAEHAVNIAEDMIYLTKGDIVRHQLN